MGDIYFEKGWVSEASEILDEGLRKFPEDEGIKELLERNEDKTDDPDNGRGPLVIGLAYLLLKILKRVEHIRHR